MFSRIHGPPTSRATRSASSAVANSRIRIRCFSLTVATGRKRACIYDQLHAVRRCLQGRLGDRLTQAEVVDYDVHEGDANSPRASRVTFPNAGAGVSLTCRKASRPRGVISHPPASDVTTATTWPGFAKGSMARRSSSCDTSSRARRLAVLTLASSPARIFEYSSLEVSERD